MSSLFELCATLSMDTAAFDAAVTQASRQGAQLAATLQQQMRSAGQGMAQAVSGAAAAWQAITAQIQAASAAARGFFSVRGGSAAAGYATGLDYVPYDNFYARLHEGEAVLTKLEASNWRSGAAQPAAGAMDASAIGAAVREALSGVAVALDGEKVGELVAPEVSEWMGREARGRRYAG